MCSKSISAARDVHIWHSITLFYYNFILLFKSWYYSFTRILNVIKINYQCYNSSALKEYYMSRFYKYTSISIDADW